MSTENTTSRLTTKSAFALGAGSALVVVALGVFAIRHDGRAEAAVTPGPVQAEASTTTLPSPVESVAPAASMPKAIPGHPMPHGTMPAADAPSVLSGTIALEESIARSVSGKVTVFVIARGGAGKGHPVYAKRLDVTSFPVSFSLSAQDSMMGQAPPDHVALEARIDVDGDAMTHEANAPSARIETVAIGSSNVSLVLKRDV